MKNVLKVVLAVAASILFTSAAIAAPETVYTAKVTVEFKDYNTSNPAMPTINNVEFLVSWSDINRQFSVGRWIFCPRAVQWTDAEGKDHMIVHAHICNRLWWEDADLTANLTKDSEDGQWYGTGTLNQSRIYKGAETIRIGTFSFMPLPAPPSN